MKKILMFIMIFVLTSCSTGNNAITQTAVPTSESTRTTMPVQVTVSPTETATLQPTEKPTEEPTEEPSPTRGPIPLATNDPTQKVIHIIVNSVSDSINGNVSSVDALIKSPGKDGISLREALTAANKTQGLKYITFDPSLKDQALKVSSESHQPLPTLSSGDVTIDGDMNQDGKPDIILDGSEGKNGNPTSFGLVIWSSGNQINGLRIQNFAGTPIIIGPQNSNAAKLIKGNRITNNEIDARRSGGGIMMGPFGITDPSTINDFTWQDTTISGNTIQTNIDFAIMLVNGGGASRNSYIGTTISENSVTGAAGVGILCADTNSNWHSNQIGTPIYSTDNLIKDTLIQNNQFDGAQFYSISILGANNGNQHNRISNATISGNVITHSPIGINITASEGLLSVDVKKDTRTTQDNILENILVEKNTIEDSKNGIFIAAAEKLWMRAPISNLANNQVNQITVSNNIINNYSVAGIEAWAGRSNDSPNGVHDNQINNIKIQGNTLNSGSQNPYAGILLIGGLNLDVSGSSVFGPSKNNSINQGNITDNHIQGAGAVILIIGGRGNNAKSNSINGIVLNQNELNGDPEIIANDAGASDNSVK